MSLAANGSINLDLVVSLMIDLRSLIDVVIHAICGIIWKRYDCCHQSNRRRIERTDLCHTRAVSWERLTCRRVRQFPWEQPLAFVRCRHYPMQRLPRQRPDPLLAPKEKYLRPAGVEDVRYIGRASNRVPEDILL